MEDKRELTSEELNEVCLEFKALGDEGRFKILLLLVKGELSVNEISEKTGFSQSATSHQLKILKTAKLLNSRKLGNTVIYFIADEHVRTIIKMSVEHLHC